MVVKKQETTLICRKVENRNAVETVAKHAGCAKHAHIVASLQKKLRNIRTRSLSEYEKSIELARLKGFQIQCVSCIYVCFMATFW